MFKNFDTSTFRTQETNNEKKNKIKQTNTNRCIETMRHVPHLNHACRNRTTTTTLFHTTGSSGRRYTGGLNVPNVHRVRGFATDIITYAGRESPRAKRACLPESGKFAVPDIRRSYIKNKKKRVRTWYVGPQRGERKTHGPRRPSFVRRGSPNIRRRDDQWRRIKF